MPQLTLLPIVLEALALVFSARQGFLTRNDDATLLFAGDAMQHKAQLDAARTGAGVYDYSECFAEVRDAIEAADYAVVNFETTLGGGNYTGYPCFSSPDSYAAALTDAGFDLLLTANNHTLDRHDRGMERTVRVLDSLGIDHIGTYRNSSERDQRIPFIRNVKGFRIAFLNYTYGTNGIKLKGNGVVDYIDRDLIAADIESARKAGAEIVAVAIHWGVEYKMLPHPSQTSLVRFLRDKGADMIIGGHPHVIQPMELTADSTGRRQLTVYSLGNFLSNMRTRDTRGGAMLTVKLSRDSVGRAVVSDAEYSLVFTVPPTGGHRNFRLLHIGDADIPPVWRSRADAFASSARAIFRTHNKSVNEKTY